MSKKVTNIDEIYTRFQHMHGFGVPKSMTGYITWYQFQILFPRIFGMSFHNI